MAFTEADCRTLEVLGTIKPAEVRVSSVAENVIIPNGSIDNDCGAATGNGGDISLRYLGKRPCVNTISNGEQRAEMSEGIGFCPIGWRAFLSADRSDFISQKDSNIPGGSEATVPNGGLKNEWERPVYDRHVAGGANPNISAKLPGFGISSDIRLLRRFVRLPPRFNYSLPALPIGVPCADARNDGRASGDSRESQSDPFEKYLLAPVRFGIGAVLSFSGMVMFWRGVDRGSPIALFGWGIMVVSFAVAFQALIVLS